MLIYHSFLSVYAWDPAEHEFSEMEMTIWPIPSTWIQHALPHVKCLLSMVLFFFFFSFPLFLFLFGCFFFFLFPLFLFLFFLFLLHYGTMKIEHLPLWESSSLQRQSMTNAVHYWWSLDTLQELCFHSTISFRGYLTHTKKKKKKNLCYCFNPNLNDARGPSGGSLQLPWGCAGLFRTDSWVLACGRCSGMAVVHWTPNVWSWWLKQCWGAIRTIPQCWTVTEEELICCPKEIISDLLR